MDGIIEDGLDISNLELGTILEIETRNSIYKFKVIEGRRGEIVGGMRRDGEDRFSIPTLATIIGSVRHEKSMPDAIVRDMQLVIVFPFKEHLSGIITTSLVQNLKVEAPDGSWSYDMKWNV